MSSYLFPALWIQQIVICKCIACEFFAPAYPHEATPASFSSLKTHQLCWQYSLALLVKR